MAFTAFSHAASAAGFGVSPSTVDFTVEKGSSASRQIIIYNTGTDAQFVAISENPSVAVLPSTGMLKEGKIAAITVTATGRKVGKSGSEILISFTRNSGNAGNEVLFSLGTRVRASLTVIESAVPSANIFVGMLTSAGIAVAGLLVYLPLRSRARRLFTREWRRA